LFQVVKAQEHICESLSNNISRKDKCLPLFLKFNLYFSTLLVCTRIDHMASFLNNHSIVPYDALNNSFVEQYVYRDRYTFTLANKQGRETRILQSDVLSMMEISLTSKLEFV
jgi:hypothetical protein